MAGYLRGHDCAPRVRVREMQAGMPPILATCPSDSTTSSSTPTICPRWPGSGPRRSAGVLSERENEIVIGADENAPFGICFMPVTDSKTAKNRVHLDLTSSAGDRAQEIDRVLALGSRRVDIGQTGAESWTVLADPEGNEFCVVRPKETLIRLRLGAECPADPVCGWSGRSERGRSLRVRVAARGLPAVAARPRPRRTRACEEVRVAPRWDVPCCRVLTVA